MFIVFEGPEGCGKSTQAHLVDEALRAEGFETVVAREPGGTPVGEALRGILLDKTSRINLRAEILLYMASRAQMIDEVIRPALEEGKIVLCERFLSSTVVYQGIAGGGDRELIDSVGAFVTDGIEPDLTIVIDIDAAEGLSRAGVPDRIESRGADYHEKVRRGFLSMAQERLEDFVVVDGSGTIEETQARIIELVELQMAETPGPGAQL